MKYLFLSFSLIVFISSADARMPAQASLREQDVLKWLERTEGWEPALISYDYEVVAADKNKLIRSYVAERYCGKGACPNYLFLKVKNSRWKFIGRIDGHFTIATDAINGFYILESSQSIPGMTEKPLTQRYYFDGQMYRPR